MTARLVLPILLLAAPGCPGMGLPEGHVVGDCDDGVDNDGDGLFDCDDDGCAGDATCAEGDTDADTDADADADTDTDADADTDIAIDALVPAWGSTQGGEVVTLQGGPFTQSDSVHFGDAPATVTTVGDDYLSVFTPAVEAPGPVNVTVRGAQSLGYALDAFVYFTDGAGQAGVIGEVTWTNLLGDFWKEPTHWGSAWLTFTEPADLHVWDLYGPADDVCVGQDWTPAISYHSMDLRVEQITLRPASGPSTILAWNPELRYFGAGDLTAGQIPQSTALLVEEVLAWDLVPIGINPVAVIPPAFTITAPAMTGATPAEVSRSTFALEWTSTPAGDRMVLRAIMWDAATTAADQTVTCVLTDDGAFSIPSRAWSSFPSGRYISVQLTRMTEHGGTLEHNGAENRVVGATTNVGLVRTR